VYQYLKKRRRDAIKTWMQILSQNPADLLALKFLTTACFYLGDSETMAEACRASVDFVPSVDRHHVWAMLAFALVEKGNVESAERYACRALQRCYHSSWAIHALCHVYLEQNRIIEGMELLSGNDGQWQRHESLTCHIFWHWAIFYLQNDDMTGALEIYDSEIFQRVRQTKGFPMDVCDAVSLLIRKFAKSISGRDGRH